MERKNVNETNFGSFWYEERESVCFRVSLCLRKKEREFDNFSNSFHKQVSDSAQQKRKLIPSRYCSRRSRI